MATNGGGPRRNGGTSHPESDGRSVLLDEPFEERDLVALRRTVAAHVDRTALPGRRVADLVLIVSELISNAVRHGGGTGRLLVWATGSAIHCQVTDEGPGLPIAHRAPPSRPEPTATGGRGLWLVRQFADALTLETAPGGGAIVTATVNLNPTPTKPTQPARDR